MSIIGTFWRLLLAAMEADEKAAANKVRRAAIARAARIAAEQARSDAERK